SPLDLAATVDHFDQPHRLVYRRYILQGLRDLYRSVDARARAQGRRLPVKLAEVLAVRGLRQWDALTVVPRFGFGDTDTYYREASAGPRLHRLRVPALLVAAEGDPMVTSASVRAGLGSWGGRRLRDAGLDVRWVEKGGHVGFPDDLDLGSEAPPGLEHQVLAWLLGHG
ncbi:MAG: hypothetical protein MI919_10455, partial [Holophagales bacterium]|nr:hypothetical protein [Holophagales bacterium]